MVVASLSLHYLPWDETCAAFRAATDLLRDGGVMLFRVNATDDVEHGAGLGVELERGFFRMPDGYRGYSRKAVLRRGDGARCATTGSPDRTP